MGLQDGGSCSGTADEGEDYKKHGSSDACNLATGLGGTNANHVYRLSKISKFSILYSDMIIVF